MRERRLWVCLAVAALGVGCGGDGGGEPAHRDAGREDASTPGGDGGTTDPEPDGGDAPFDAGRDASSELDGSQPDASGPDAGACDPIAQLGCAVGQKCTDVDGLAGCRPNGTVHKGEACAGPGEADNCVAGLACFRNVCERLCDVAGDDCHCFPAGGVLSGQQGVGLCFAACSAETQDCARAGDACFVNASDGRAACAAPVPANGEGDPCGAQNDCAADHQCIIQYEGAESAECARQCDVAAGTRAACAEGDVCLEVDDIYQTTLFGNLAVCVDCARAPDAAGCQP
jgi:hypothetical protein